MNTVRKFEEILFYFLLFAIPFQTRKILWQQNWYFNEWQTVSVYATDLLFLILAGIWVFNWKTGDKKSLFFKIQKFDYFLFIFLAISAISIKNSTSPAISWFQFSKLAEFVLFYFYIKSYAFYRFNFTKTLWVVFAGGVFQSVVAIGQFLKQSDLGLRWFGESMLGPNLSGVASFFNAAGEKIIRAYGTTPHPNILAAYLFLSIFTLYFLWLYAKPKLFDISNNSSLIYQTKNSLLFALCSLLLLFAFFFTFSRTIIFLWAAGFTAMAGLIWLKKDFRKIFWSNQMSRRRLAEILVVTVIAIGIFAIVYWPEVSSRLKISAGDEAVQLRIFYGKESLKSGLNLFGLGVGNFVNWFMKINPNLPRHLYQPVHNIYLLIYSETGLLGLVSFVLFIVFLIRDFIRRTQIKTLLNYSFLLIFTSFLIIGFFDHFLWTLQQGRFMFWLATALMAFNFRNILYHKKDA